MTISFEDFEANVRRWFLAERTSTEDMRSMYECWLEASSRQSFLRGLRRHFAPENLVAFGCAWWEERQQGRIYESVTTELDEINMYITSWPFPPGKGPKERPTPRPYCPPEIVGTWRCVGKRTFGDATRTVVEIAGGPEWTFGADGRLSVKDDPKRDGLPWRVFLSEVGYGDIILGTVHPEKVMVWKHRGSEMETSQFKHGKGALIWRRV
jgi:hypothetical protein